MSSPQLVDVLVRGQAPLRVGRVEQSVRIADAEISRNGGGEQPSQGL